MKFSTKVSIEDYQDKISYRDKIITLGSCFSDEIGSRLESYSFRICLNPFGVLYNPASVASALERLANNRKFTVEDIIEDGDVWKSLYHSSSHADYTKESLLETVNTSLSESSLHFAQSRWVLVTLGTRWIYRLKSNGVVVSNCHKLPQTRFSREEMGVGEIVSILSPYIESCKDKIWLFTVSPVRHLKDGAHENQISKATLLLAVDELRKKYSNVLYFPAYEVFMDELRDYRYYAEDMIHPSTVAINYIWELFTTSLIKGEDIKLMDLVRKLNEMNNHRPFFQKSDSFKKFETERSKLQGVVSELLKEKFL